MIAAHAFVWARRLELTELERAIAGAARAGFDAVVLPTREPADFPVAAVTRLLETHGITPINGIALAEGCDIASADRAVAMRGERRLADAIAVARDLGSEMLTGLTHSPLARPRAACDQDERARLVEALARVAAVADAAGVQLGLEAVNRYESARVNTAADALALVHAIGAGNVFVHLDTYHMNIEEDDPAAAVERCGARLGYLEFSESQRGGLGTGTVDHAAVAAALARIDYHGPVGFEAFSPAVLDPPLAAGHAAWRTCWADSDAIAASARVFIAELVRR